MLADLPDVSPVDSAPSAPGDARFLGVIAHLSSLVAPVLGPAVVYVIARAAGAADHGRQHAAAALNFHLTMVLVIPMVMVGHFALAMGEAALTLGIGNLLSLATTAAGSFIGWFIFAAGFLLLELICMVIGCVAAASGRPFTYPLALPLFS